jgi:hypothetical protein
MNFHVYMLTQFTREFNQYISKQTDYMIDRLYNLRRSSIMATIGLFIHAPAFAAMDQIYPSSRPALPPIAPRGLAKSEIMRSTTEVRGRLNPGLMVSSLPTPPRSSTYQLPASVRPPNLLSTPDASNDPPVNLPSNLRP